MPKWLEYRYSILWDAFKNSPFGMENAIRILKEKNRDRREEIPVFISELRKAGWLNVEFDPHDSRKRIYTLKSKEAIVSELFSINKNAIGRGEIEGLLLTILLYWSFFS